MTTWTPKAIHTHKVIRKERFKYNGIRRTVGVIEESDGLMTGYVFGENGVSLFGDGGRKQDYPIKSFKRSKMTPVARPYG